MGAEADLALNMNASPPGEWRNMKRPQFITPPMSIVLDAVRGGAAFVVLGGHIVQMKLYTGSYPFGPMAQHWAVIVFFILSGLVIAHSTCSSHYTLRDYAIARAARILPVSLFALAFGTVIYLVLNSMGLSPALAPPPYDRLAPAALVLPAVFLGESGQSMGPVWNPPYWSLTYEVWFYALFAAGFFLRGGRRLRWLATLGVLAGWRILLMLPIWMLGAAVMQYGARWQPKGVSGLVLTIVAAGMLSLAIWLSPGARELAHQLHAVAGYDVKFSEYFMTDLLFGAGVATIFVLARPLAESHADWLYRCAGPVKWIAGFSFSLYLLHWPMLSAISALGLRAGGSALGFLAIVAGVVGVCAFVAQFTEMRSHGIRAALQRRFTQPVATVATA